jgi:hypothetical protein
MPSLLSMTEKSVHNNQKGKIPMLISTIATARKFHQGIVAEKIAKHPAAENTLY